MARRYVEVVRQGAASGSPTLAGRIESETEMDRAIETGTDQRPNHWCRKRIRLDASAYSVPGSVWHVTVATANRRRIFADPAAAKMAIETIHERCAIVGSVDLLVCVMPDHVHMLIQIDRGNLVNLVRGIKSILGIWCRRNGWESGDVWQRSFYDKGIRNEIAMELAGAYIINNPVVEGLVEDWSEYPWISGKLIEGET